MICLYGETAMEFWHTAQVMEARVIDAYAKAGSCPEEDELLLTNYLEGKRISLNTCGAPSLKRDLVEHLAAKHMLTLPLKLAVGNKKDVRHAGDLTKTTVLCACASHPEFIVIDSKLAVASPAFCAIADIRKANAIANAKLLSSMLSSYALDKWAGNSILRASALTKRSDVVSCANQLLSSGSTRQIGRAQEALRALGFVAEGAFSPREGALQLLFCLPQRVGGYGLPVPLLNPRISVSKARSLRPDLYWPKAAIDVEYNGVEYHSTSEQVNHDELRKAALTNAGITVIDVNNAVLNNISTTRKIAAFIAKAHGMRFRTPGKDFGERHAALRALLLS